MASSNPTYTVPEQMRQRAVSDLARIARTSENTHEMHCAIRELERRAVEPTVVGFVKLGYGDSHDLPVRSLDFRTESITDFATFAHCARAIGGYNRFDADTVIEALKPIWGELMGVKIGRESSPVIYADVPHWTHQRNDSNSGGGQPIPEPERREIAARFLEAMRLAQADSLGHRVYGQDWTWHHTSSPVGMPASEIDSPPLDEKVTALRAWFD